MESLQKPWLLFPVGQWARQYQTKNTQSSTRGGTNISVYYAAKPRGPKRTHASSSTVGVKISGKQANSQRRGGLSQQRYAQTQITAPSQQSSTQKQQSIIWVIITKILQKPKARRNPKIPDSQQGIQLWRRWKRNGSTMLYSQSLHHTYAQRIQTAPWSAEIRRISGVIVMALRLSTSSKNTRGLKRDSNAKFAAPRQRRDTVMVRKAGKGNNWKLGWTHRTVHK
jgi:hypothetical protein